MHVCVGMVILQEVHFKNTILKIEAVHFFDPLPAILRPRPLIEAKMPPFVEGPSDVFDL